MQTKLVQCAERMETKWTDTTINYLYETQMRHLIDGDLKSNTHTHKRLMLFGQNNFYGAKSKHCVYTVDIHIVQTRGYFQKFTVMQWKKTQRHIQISVYMYVSGTAKNSVRFM